MRPVRDEALPPTAGRGTAALTTVRRHPASRFLVSGGLTFLVDISALQVLHGVLGVPLLLATALAFGFAFVVNFTLSRHWTFPASRDGRAHRQAVRFAMLVGANLASTLLVVGALSALGVYYLLAKVAAVVLNAVANFFAYRHWVFR